MRNRISIHAPVTLHKDSYENSKNVRPYFLLTQFFLCVAIINAICTKAEKYKTIFTFIEFSPKKFRLSA